VSEFSGLNLALSALQAQRRGLELAAQNAANTNTEGYSRQAIGLETVGTPSTPALFSTNSGSLGGVRVADITRYRDAFLEAQAALEHGAMANLDVLSSKMQNIEQLFNEPSDNGISKQLSDFWAGFDDVANHPENTASRTQLIERARTLSQTFNSISDALSKQVSATKSELGATVTDVNAKADQIAQLNKAIKAGQISGLPVNDLMDKRDLLANQLAEATGGSIRATEWGQVNVTVGGTAIVSGDHSTHLALDTSGSPTVLRWANTNAVATITSGKAGGQLTAINATIPNYIAKLDAVAMTLRDTVNNLHSEMSGSIDAANQDQTAAGNLQFQIALDGGAYQTVTVAGADWSGVAGATNLQTALQNAVNAAIGAGNATVAVTGGNGSPISVALTPTAGHSTLVQATRSNNGFTTLLGTTAVGLDGVGGRQFFTGTDALSLAVSSDVDGNPNGVAAGLAANGPLDASRALDFADLSQSLTGPDTSYQQMIVQLGVDTSTAKNRADIQDKATGALDGQRQAYSGVNNDDELGNMVMFQHAYEAAARFLTAIDQILDTLINRTAV
jgi:flagellar hook-associated protein 1 FlgK